MTAPIDGHAITDGEDDFSLTFYTYKMLKKCGKTVQDFDPFLDLWEGV